MKKNPHGLKVGQVLWFVGSQRCFPDREIEVVRLGNKYAYVGYANNPMRIFLDSLTVDNGEYSSSGRCYLSKAEYETKKAIAQGWSDMIRKLCHIPPAHITLSDVEVMNKIISGEPK